MSEANLTITLPGYRIVEQLYRSSRIVVYRAFQEISGKKPRPVVVKLLRQDYPSFSELLQFRNQYTIAKKLDIPGIIRPYALESYHNSYALIMEDFGGISLREYMKRGHIASLLDILSIALPITNILHHLYHNRVIHKDIKPENILINPETKQVKLIDFGIASLLPKETQEIKNINALQGTLAYLSPEQTGRMNRGIDYRSDFYSLGVTFYELLTGQLPFISDDPMELVHCHIAKTPPSINSAYSQVISDIVMKLMAKNAEDRYQSALGLKSDLEICLKQLQDTGKIEYFEIAKRDICDRFIIPDKLYGREAEVQTLLAAFERVAGTDSRSKPSNEENIPKAELILVAGFSGIGKTAVVNEIHKPIVKQRGYFIKGKFDQFNRNSPYYAFVQAFRDLMGQLLSESDIQLSSFKHKILQALGDSAQVIVEVVPELEQIIGQQPPVPELWGIANQNRFNLLFQKFIQVFTTKDHPLVIFLDDLQWADSASLKLMQFLMSESQSRYLLLIGAYRDNEVSVAHPLMLTLEEIASSETIINTITLASLSTKSLNQLIADTLNSSPLIAQPLTQLVYQKTKGNPFFSTQFLKALYEDGLIKFDITQSSLTKGEGVWECDIAKVRAKALALTDNIVDFMALQLQKLPEETQDVLKLGACIGNQFDLTTLAIVCQKSETETAQSLWKALQFGLILPSSEVYKFYLDRETQDTLLSEQIVNYKFLHDRVQQAAYSLIPDNQKQTTHYYIGQLLLQQISPSAREDSIFELVNQLNYGTALITEQKERDQLAQLNLIACSKAKSANAYQAGHSYAKIGLSLLGENAWERQYEINLALYELAAELAMLNGDFEEMEQLIDIVIKQAHSLLEQVNVYRIRIQSNVCQNQLTSAITIAQQLLQQLGVTFPKTPSQKDIQQAIAEISKLIGDRKIEDLVQLPQMTNAEKIAIIQIANSIIPVAYVCDSPLFPLLISLSVKLSIQYGNTSASAFAYACYGSIACNMTLDVNTGVQFGQLALQIVSQLNAKAFKPEVINAAALFTLHRKSHTKKMLPLLEESYTNALEVGNHEMAGYSAQIFCFNSFWCGQPLITLKRKVSDYCSGLVELNQLTVANYCQIYWQSILNLIGDGEDFSLLSGEALALPESEFLSLLKAAHDLYGLSFFYLCKLMLCYLQGEIESAQNHADELRNYLMGAAGTVCEPAFYFYDSLTALATLTQSPKTPEILQRVEENQMRLQQQWADYAPMNHQHKVDLVEAEKARVLGQKAEAIELYEKAISGAKANEYIQEEALANELAAKFFVEWCKEKFAAVYMLQAYYCYARWGAEAKTDDLEKRYPQLLAPILKNQDNHLGFSETQFQSFDKSSLNRNIQTTRSNTTQTESLDLASIFKASQALSNEIQLEQLISKLMQVAMENAGAKKAALVLLKENNLMLKAVANLNENVTLLNLPYQDSKDIPTTIVNYVKRSFKIVVLDDATAENDFIADSYVMQQKPKSLLCMPILNQGKLIGLLYLENNLTIGAFTQNRVNILNLLTTQAAISLENAQLYRKLEEHSHTLEQKVEQRTQEVTQKATQLESAFKELQNTQAQLIQAEKMSGLGQLVAGIAHEINNPISFIYGNLTPANEYVESLIDLINLYQNSLSQTPPEIEEKIADIELDFIIDDLPKLLASMKTGAQRIRDIVLSLRNFSRLDEAEMKLVDIHSGINSTLLIKQLKISSNNKYPEIEVIKEYNQLPDINCYAAQINQVLINIIDNAIDALRQKQENDLNFDNPKITISTSPKDNQNILIRIADNGVGISKSILNKIFDPFFTTKPVGNGTGLGLSTSYSIVVEKHGGKLSCISTPGEGTEFVIELPI
ncbi:AAA family ATPase [Calothrix sp. CCY 0018]|uniref:trifunctional serine/threonine-protein kinase/ATP-binding protein/sensor histidine kinase n=1 Tax=Calothrix sp. CCY 0018 TaxID=3103864 RepID=UPI0039C5B5BA